MLRDSRKIEGLQVLARDGTIGRVKDLYFEEPGWTARYFVVDTGGLLTSRPVLISPVAFRAPRWEANDIPVDLTQEQVRRSPGLDADRPVSRAHEEELHDFYGWPHYWVPEAYTLSGATRTAAAPRGRDTLADASPESAAPRPHVTGDPHLHSMNEVRGYHIGAVDGEIGHVEDFLIEDAGWVVRYVVVDTRNWWPGRKVLIAPEWMRTVDWGARRVVADLTREAIQGAPEYDPSAPVNDAYVDALHTFYQRPRSPTRQ